MIMGSSKTCPKCDAGRPAFWSNKQKTFMCSDCQREFNPPTMTLIDYRQGDDRIFWNMEVGVHESFYKLEDIEWCGWQLRCKQETLYSRVPRVLVTVYHMEFHGTVACGRCTEYPYFNNEMTQCMSVACEPAAKAQKLKREIQYPVIKSRYAVWSGLWEA